MVHLCVYDSFHWEMLHPRNPPNPETQILRYVAVQIQIEISF